MALALSVNNAVADRGCNFTGCEHCPYRVMGYRNYACIREKAGSDLVGIFALADLLDTDVSAFRDLFNQGLEEVFTETEDYRLISLEQIATFVALLEDLLERAQALYQTSACFLLPDYESRAKQSVAAHWIEAGRDENGAMRLGISRLIFSLSGANYFLKRSLEIHKAVEIGRYHFGRIERVRL